MEKSEETARVHSHKTVDGADMLGIIGQSAHQIGVL